MDQATVVFTGDAAAAERFGGLFAVVPARVTLTANDVLSACEAHCRNHETHLAHIRSGGRYREYVRVRDLGVRVRQAIESGTDLGFATADEIRAIAYHAIIAKRFLVGHCGACAADYPPEAFDVRAWSAGRPFASHGGQHVVCPAGHTVYAEATWLS